MWICRARFLPSIKACRETSACPCFLVYSSSYSEIPHKKDKATPLQERRMIDRFRMHVKGGDGGNGSSSFRRSRHDRHGKPDGGNGGRGGDVILQCTSAIWDFRGLQHHVNGRRGGHGASKNMIGSRGEDKVVQVPVGTVIHLVAGEIPSWVEKPPPGGANPWDIPGALTTDSSESNQPSTSSSHLLRVQKIDGVITDTSYSCTKIGHKNLAGIKQLSRASLVESHSQPSLSYSNATHARTEILSNDTENGDSEFVGPADDTAAAAYDDTDDDDDQDTDDDLPEDWEEEEKIQYNIAELTEEGQRIVVARGGDGGIGSVASVRVGKRNLKNTKNYSSGKNAYEPGFNDEDQSSIIVGLLGSEAILILELKSIADVGLVGIPNAGKSTLLGAISRAKPAVGHYAFTTLRPNIGKLNYDNFSVSVADIPGLIKGAHQNRGLGHAFLRHIERTKVLAYVVDLAAAIHGRNGVPPWEQLRDLVLELEYYREGLSDCPSLVVANKIDEEGAELVYEELQRRVQGIRIFPVCAVLEEGIEEVKDGLRMLVDGGESSRLSLQSISID